MSVGNINQDLLAKNIYTVSQSPLNIQSNYPNNNIGSTIPPNYSGLAPLQNDTLTFSRNSQAKFNTETSKQNHIPFNKIFLGLGALATAGAIVALLCQGRVQKAKTLAEHIDFNPAKTLEEAIEFGRTHLGIKKYKGFESQNLDVVNWYNEGLVNISNKVKGNISTPDIVKYTELPGKMYQSVDSTKRLYRINKNIYDNIDTEINKLIDMLLEIKPDGSIILPKADCSYSALNSFVKNIKKYKSDQASLSFKEKVQLHLNLYEYGNSLGKFKYEPVSPFGTIYHECHHLMDSNLLKHSETNISIDKNIAEKISQYAPTNEAEFIAEIGRRHMEGHTLSEEALRYYDSIGGPKLYN